MNWKYEAIEKLKEYSAKKQSLKSIPEEMARLESAMQSIRSATSDGTPVSGGGSGREDMMLSNIVHREELARSLEQARKWVSLVDSGLEVLTGDEHKATFKTVSSSRIDTAALKKGHPDIAAQYTKTTETKRFIFA